MSGCQDSHETKEEGSSPRRRSAFFQWRSQRIRRPVKVLPSFSFSLAFTSSATINQTLQTSWCICTDFFLRLCFVHILSIFVLNWACKIVHVCQLAVGNYSFPDGMHLFEHYLNIAFLKVELLRNGLAAMSDAGMICRQTLWHLQLHVCPLMVKWWIWSVCCFYTWTLISIL